MSASPARMRSWYRFKCRQVDGVGEVRDQQLAALGFEARPVRSEVSKLMIPPGALLIERRVDFGGEVPVVVVADRDVRLGVLDQAFGDLDGDGTSGAVGLLGRSPGADEVSAGRAARVRREVQQHPRPTQPPRSRRLSPRKDPTPPT